MFHLKLANRTRRENPGGENLRRRHSRVAIAIYRRSEKRGKREKGEKREKREEIEEAKDDVTGKKREARRREKQEKAEGAGRREKREQGMKTCCRSNGFETVPTQ